MSGERVTTEKDAVLNDAERVRLNRINLWCEVLLDPDRDERITPIRPVVEALRAEARRGLPSALLAEVQAVYDLQCPVMQGHFADDEFGRGAVAAHTWWQTCLGGVLRRHRQEANRG